MSPPSTFQEAARPLAHWILGPDRLTRTRMIGVLVCTVVYLVCCAVAYFAGQVGFMKPWAAPVLTAVSVPASLLYLVLLRSGWSGRLSDPSMMLPQNLLALAAIAFAYVAIGPRDRGLVFILLALVSVFGMYTHRPKMTMLMGGGAVLLLSLCMVVLTQIDPVYYPANEELLRFELLGGCIPVMVFTAYQLTQWRDRLRKQRGDLKEVLARVQHLATRDTLTGLYNRRYMQERLDECVQRLERHGERFTLALIDLDHFKRINDQYGHRVGDEVLATFAMAASAVLRESDVLARWGGEEFLIIFPDAAPEQAGQALIRLREQLPLTQVSATEPGLRVAFSAGLSLHAAHATLGHTLERADAALYKAKHLGRDRVVIDSGGAPPATEPPTEPSGIVAH